jgi:hypothetical protein
MAGRGSTFTESSCSSGWVEREGKRDREREREREPEGGLMQVYLS